MARTTKRRIHSGDPPARKKTSRTSRSRRRCGRPYLCPSNTYIRTIVNPKPLPLSNKAVRFILTTYKSTRKLRRQRTRLIAGECISFPSTNILTALESYFSGFPIRVLAGCERQALYVHSTALLACNSPSLTALVKGGWKESTDREVDWTEFDYYTIERFLIFLYTGDYRVPEPWLDTRTTADEDAEAVSALAGMSYRRSSSAPA